MDVCMLCFFAGYRVCMCVSNVVLCICVCDVWVQPLRALCQRLPGQVRK